MGLHLSHWRVIMLLADSAQVANDKLYILGGGWTQVASPVPPTAVAIKVDVPWDETNREHTLEVELVNSDGPPVLFSFPPSGEMKPLKFNAKFTAGRPPWAPQGAPLPFSMAFTIAPMPLVPGRYAWTLSINGESQDGWEAAFTVLQPPQGVPGPA